MPAQDSRMDTPGDVAELFERASDLSPRLIETSTRLGIAAQPLLEQAELERERDQPLLCAVVEIAFQALPLFLARRKHACPRASELFEPRLQLGVQACVLERNAGSSSDRVEKLALVVECRIVEQRGDVRPVAVDQRRSSAVAIRDLHSPPIEIAVAPEVGKPVGACQRRVAQ